MSQNNKKRHRVKKVLKENPKAALSSPALSAVMQAFPQALSRLPPAETLKFISNMRSASKSMASSIARWPNIRRTVDKNGIGDNLVDITTRVWPDPVTFKTRLALLHKNEAMSTIPGHIKSGIEQRGKGGMTCERVDCVTNNRDKRPNPFAEKGAAAEDKPKIMLRRCSKCKQVSYCSRECQKTDWGRHRVFCKAVEQVMQGGDLSKDTFSKLIQSVLSNPCLSVLLKNYATDLLELRRQPRNGLMKNIVFTCTFIEENVGDTINAPSTWILQILHVAVEDFDPTTIEGLEIQRELLLREVFFQDPAVTSALVVRELSVYKTTLEPNLKMDASRNLAICDIPVAMTFKSDIEGATSTVSSVERVQWVLLINSIELPESVMWLLQFNRTVREDLENNMRCRVPKLW